MSKTLYRTVYISHSTIPDNLLKTQLDDIKHTSSKNNLGRKISGQLVHCHHTFIQILEGEEQSLKTLLSKIEQDSRHCGMQVIFSAAIDVREYPDWQQMEVITDEARLAKFGQYIQSIAALPLNTISSTQVQNILFQLSAINKEKLIK